ncbi:hypothetical protein SAMN04487786_2418 [Paenisporosarcina quisquiliarum]|nr:hypothetical protein SAMN04487786_2418 [Paenisporosarcina quisquiliarum]
MSVSEYVRDKRYFLLFYTCLMLFISMVMLFSENDQYNLSNVLYINISCVIFVCLYITIGYFYRKAFFKGLVETIENAEEQFAILFPEVQTNQQKRFLELLKKIHQDNRNQLQHLNDEKKDQQEFILSWIHEVKLPIAASRLLMENSENKTKDYLIDKFEDELDKIDNYVEQALYYSRIDSFSTDYFITEVTANQIIKSSVKKYSKLFINKEIQFQMDDSTQFVQSDSKWLGFVIDQIIANSIKYTERGGKVAVQFEEDDREKRISILDSGIGIATEDLSRVFQKGFTGLTGRNQLKSTGIGLYLAKQLTRKLGHTLSIQSEEGTYTKVTIHFPKIRNYMDL